MKYCITYLLERLHDQDLGLHFRAPSDFSESCKKLDKQVKANFIIRAKLIISYLECSSLIFALSFHHSNMFTVNNLTSL